MLNVFSLNFYFNMRNWFGGRKYKNKNEVDIVQDEFLIWKFGLYN